MLNCLEVGSMNAAAMRAEIYAGKILRRPVTTASMALAEGLMSAVRQVLGADPRGAAERVGDVNAALADLRRHVMTHAHWWSAIAAVVSETGFDLRRQRVDCAMLRALPSHVSPAAAPRGAYAVHRDTWYANPPCQVNWWLAVHDVKETESFAFYPKYFAVPIANDSSKLDLTRPWAEDSPPPAPDTIERPPLSEAVRFSLAKGEMLLFSGAHLHGGVPVTSGLIRFSMDFRTVDEDDLDAGRSAPMLDGECLGQAVAGYRKLDIGAKIS
jgi:ectoine hydroxylase-related dioxygenase (phytanoyl-CoA dioxygenase family)